MKWRGGIETSELETQPEGLIPVWSNLFLSMPSESDDTARGTELNPSAGKFICQEGTPSSAAVSTSFAFTMHPSALQQSDIA